MTIQSSTAVPEIALASVSGPRVALIPAYNEERFIGSVVLKARRYVDVVLVVDDGSSDDTATLAEEAGAEVIRHSHNTGKAAALNTGLDRARALNAAALVLLDGDGQHDPSDIPALLVPTLAGQADVVIGSRFIGVESDTPRWRIAGQQALTMATNFASGVTLSDSQTGFRALSRRAVQQLVFRTTGFSVESEMQFLVKRYDLTVGEVPIRVNYNEKPKRNPVRHGLQVLNGIIQMVSQNRPLFFFGVPGVLLLIIGTALALLVVDRYTVYTRLAVGWAIVSMGAITVGALTIFTGLILHTIRAYLHDR
ncbi:MAG: glycosyltransferase family 2 protein [Aggregatilineales bacterium]